MRLRALADDAGLACVARHLLLPDLDDVPPLARNMAILGARHGCSSGVRVWTGGRPLITATPRWP